MLQTLQSAYTWIILALMMIFWLPLLAVIRIFDRDAALYRTGRWFRRLGATMTRVNPFWTIEVSGKMPDDPRNPYVVVCNHQSLADIPIVSLLPWEMKWIAKAELWKTPMVGWMMSMAGDIPVDRNDKRSRAKALVKAREYLHRRCSVMFFPEGTRSPDGRVRRFREGAFGLAISDGTPILVLALDGTHDALPKKSWRFSPSGAIRLKVIGEVPTDGRGVTEARPLAEEVRQMVVRQLAEWRGSDPEEIDALERKSDFSSQG